MDTAGCNEQLDLPHVYQNIHVLILQMYVKKVPLLLSYGRRSLVCA